MKKLEFIKQLKSELIKENPDFSKFDKHIQHYYQQVWFNTVDEYFDNLKSKYIKKKQKVYDLHKLFLLKISG